MTSTPHSPTSAMLLTPSGRGAIATICVAGPRAVEAADACFRAASGRSLTQVPRGQIVFGRWHSHPTVAAEGEEVVVCRVAADRIEIHGHGGRTAAATILQSLAAQGCSTSDWPAWFTYQAGEPIEQQAAQALCQAATEQAAAVLLDQQRGALTGQLRRIVQAIEADQAEQAITALDALLQWADLGQHLVQPWRVVLAGPPNVGKSSLINAIVGYQRALVFDQPGTTRDVVTVETAIEGWPMQLADTAGLRRTTADPLEAAGMERTRTILAQADLVLLVRDAGQGTDKATDLALPEQSLALARRHLHVLNKIDLAPADSTSGVTHPADPPRIATSATTGQGIPELIRQIARALVPEPPAAGTPLPFTEAQVQSLHRARQWLSAGQVDAACRAVRRLFDPRCAGTGTEPCPPGQDAAPSDPSPS